jgi:hypothetical protein
LSKLKRLIFFHFCSNIWENQKILMLKKIREFLFPRWLKHYGHFLSFKLPRKIINIERISFLPKLSRHFWKKSWCLKFLGILGTLGKFWHSKNLKAIEEIVCYLIILGRVYKGWKEVCHIPPFLVIFQYTKNGT